MDRIATDPRYCGYQNDFNPPLLATFEEYYAWWEPLYFNFYGVHNRWDRRSKEDIFRDAWRRYRDEENEKYEKDIKIKGKDYSGWKIIGRNGDQELYNLSHSCLRSDSIWRKKTDLSKLRVKHCYFCFNVPKKIKRSRKEEKFIYWLHGQCNPSVKSKKEKEMAFKIDIQKIRGITHPNNVSARQTLRKLHKEAIEEWKIKTGSTLGGEYSKDLQIIEKEKNGLE